MVESVFWPRWQVSTWAQVGSKYLLCPPLNFSECFSGSLLVVCLFVCFSQTNKNCWLQPFRTCHRLAAIVTLVAISALTKLVAWLLLSLVNFITLDQVQGKIFLLELSLGHVHWTFFFHLSIGGADWIPRTVFHINWFKRAQATSLPAYPLDQLTWQAIPCFSWPPWLDQQESYGIKLTCE